jgi:hypothetical protein
MTELHSRDIGKISRRIWKEHVENSKKAKLLYQTIQQIQLEQNSTTIFK